MKVAVISAVPTCGKTTLIELLGGIYSRSHEREVVIFSTGNAQDNIEVVRGSKQNHMDNPYIIKALIETPDADAEDLRKYGVQAGDEHVYIFDIMNSKMAESDKEQFLVNAINNVPADLTLVEIVGDINTPLNEDVLKACDCSFILSDLSLKSLHNVQRIVNSIPASAVKLNSAVVLSKYNPNIASEKRVAEILKTKTTNLFKLPYIPLLSKIALNGELDKIIYNIVRADHEVVALRVPIQELMEYIFNSPERKVVRSIDRWYK